MSTYGLWLSAAGMKVNEHRQTLLANNMANMNTTGFKHDLAVVSQRRIESRVGPGASAFVHPVLDGLSGGIQVLPTYQDFTQGPIQRTGGDLDAAVQGEGFFVVSDGEMTRYTRDGQFAVNSAGELVLGAGNGRWKVLDEGGATITLTADSGKASISADGRILQEGNEVGKLALVTVADRQALRKVGENLFKLTRGEMVPATGRIVPGSREGSNFDVMSGLAEMIQASRAYQLNATMIQLQDQATGQAVNTVGRVA